MADRTISVELRALTDQYKRNMAQAGAATKQTGVHATGTSKAMGGMMFAAKRLIPVLGVAGLARSARQAVRQSVELESSLTKMETLVGLTAGEVGELSSGFGDLTSKTGIANQELADAAFFISSAGLRGSEALDALEASATAAAIGLGDTRVVADLVTSAMNAYGAETLSASQATDILVGAVRAGKAEAPQLAAAMGRVLPIASEMGVSFDEVGAAVAAMTRTGTDAAQATTQLRGILMALLRPSEQAEAALREFGLSGEMMRQTLQEQGLLATLELLTGTFDGNEEALARVIPRAEGLMGVMDLMGANVEDTRQIFEDMTDTTGLAEDGLRRYQETTEFQLNRASAQWAEFKTNVADKSLPAINWALQDMNKTMEEGLLSSTSNLLSAPFSWIDDLADRLWNIDWPSWFTGDAGVWDPPELDVSGVTFGLSEAEQAFLDLQTAGPGAAGAVDDVGDALDGAGESASTAEEQLSGYLDTLRAATDPVYALDRAVQAVEEAHDNYNKTLNDNEATQRDVERAAFDVAMAVGDLERAALDGDLSFSEFDRQLARWVAQGRITSDQADDIRGRVTDLTSAAQAYDGTYQANMIAHTETAEQRLARIRALIASIPSRISTTVFADTSQARSAIARVARTGRMEAIHTGGYIHPSGKLQRFHTGGMVGGQQLKSDEVPAILQTGEMVLSRAQVAQLGDVFSGRGGDGAASPVVNVYGRPDPVATFRARELLREAV